MGTTRTPGRIRSGGTPSPSSSRGDSRRRRRVPARCRPVHAQGTDLAVRARAHLWSGEECRMTHFGDMRAITRPWEHEPASGFCFSPTFLLLFDVSCRRSTVRTNLVIGIQCIVRRSLGKYPYSSRNKNDENSMSSKIRTPQAGSDDRVGPR